MIAKNIFNFKSYSIPQKFSFCQFNLSVMSIIVWPAVAMHKKVQESALGISVMGSWLKLHTRTGGQRFKILIEMDNYF